MLKIEFEFQSPEEAAIAMQAIIAAKQGSIPTPAPQVNPTPPVAPMMANPAMGSQTPPTSTAPAAPTTPAPAAATLPPATPAANTAPPSVPVAAAPAYTQEQIMTAGAALIDAGKMGELMTLLNTFGVQAVTQLKPEQLGAFATELRKLGAQI
jgi:hypothetical protein